MTHTSHRLGTIWSVDDSTALSKNETKFKKSVEESKTTQKNTPKKSENNKSNNLPITSKLSWSFPDSPTPKQNKPNAPSKSKITEKSEVLHEPEKNSKSKTPLSESQTNVTNGGKRRKKKIKPDKPPIESKSACSFSDSSVATENYKTKAPDKSNITKQYAVFHELPKKSEPKTPLSESQTNVVKNDGKRKKKKRPKNSLKDSKNTKPLDISKISLNKSQANVVNNVGQRRKIKRPKISPNDPQKNTEPLDISKISLNQVRVYGVFV